MNFSSNTNSYSQSQSQYIPDTLVSLIFEYLPLSDYPNVTICSKRFNRLVKDSFSEWAKSTFAQYIDFTMDHQLESQSLVSPWNLKNRTILFDDSTDPKQIMKSHSTIKGEWGSFLGGYLSHGQKEGLLHEIFEVLRNPPTPMPRLKRDMMAFHTNTVFQNFLTEVYFQLNKKCSMKDQKSILLGEIVERLQGSEEDLDNLLFNSEEKTEESLAIIAAQTNDGTKLYNLVYLMAQNYCQMIRSYLSSIREPLVFLEQYYKLWSNYVLITIDFDEMLTCFSDYMNKLYNKSIGSSSELERLAAWRILRQVWTQEVFNQISSSLGNIINSLIADLRGEKDESKTEETVTLIQDVYNAVSDLSYDECTIFFWDCESSEIETPKGEMNSNILKNIYTIYDETELLSGKSTNCLTSVFEKDKKLIKELFGKELAYYITELQAHFLKNSLQKVFEASLEKVESSAVPEAKEDFLKPLELNVMKVMKIIDIDYKEKSQNLQRKDVQRRLIETTLKACPLFEVYLLMIGKFEIKLRTQREKFEKKRMILLNSGFYPTEDKYQDSMASPDKDKDQDNGEISVFG